VTKFGVVIAAIAGLALIAGAAHFSASRPTAWLASESPEPADTSRLPIALDRTDRPEQAKLESAASARLPSAEPDTGANCNTDRNRACDR
jgi:hypothetical protein